MKVKREWVVWLLLPCCLVLAVLTGIALAANGSSPTAVQADADTLAKTLVSEGITYEDAVVLQAGNGYQYGTFTGLPEDFYGFGDGIILSSGNAVKAFTSKPSANVGTKWSDYSGSTDIAEKAYRKLYDEYASFCNLAKVSPQSINDAAVFAIKVTPTTNALSFRYFFASNEYNQAAQFNDTFALWVVRDFGETSETWTNIAKLRTDQKPDGALSDVVNIQNTCPGCSKGGKYKTDIKDIYKFNDNKIIGYLGRTEPLDAEIGTLTPGEPVWVVMAVGDASDHNFDSAVFIKARSIKFAKASQTTITYDANGGEFSGNAVKKGVDVESDATYTVGDHLTPTRSGYVFDGWYDAETGGTKAGATATASADAVWYAHWTPVTSTVTVDVKQDGSAMPGGTTVELRQNGATVHTLTRSGGTWTATGVPNGTYQLFVNGENVERTVTVNATVPGGTVSANAVDYYTVTANVTLDGNNWSGQTAALSDGTPLTGSGSYTAVLREKTTGNNYDVLVNGEKKGTVTVTASGNKSVTAAYHTITVTVNDTAAWTDAAVTLRNGGADAHKLTYKSTSGTSAVFTTILPATDTTAYKVFVGGKDVGKTVSTTSKTATATFYTASVKITGGFSNMPVTIYNGTDSYTLTGGTTNGSTPYTCAHVFSGAAYSITVGGTIGTVTNTITDATAVDLTYCTVTFKNSNKSSDYATQYVLRGQQAQSVSVPFKTGNVSLGWDTNQNATTASFDFSTAINANTTLYPVYEAAGIVLGEQIQTGNTSVYTYQMPNLTIKGYKTVSSVVLKVTNCGSISAVSGATATTALDASGNGTIILTFSGDPTGATVQNALRSMTVTVKDHTQNHTIQATVYGTQN